MTTKNRPFFGNRKTGGFYCTAQSFLPFSRKGSTILHPRNRWAIAPAFVLCVGGYYTYESLITGNWGAALLGIPGYCIQVAASAAVYLALGKLLDGVKFKERLFH